jgi:tRNA nucleotidyltransferase (CCA-adding enzyme)
MPDVIAHTDELMASLGLEVYRVGGSVRDELLGKRPKDADYMVRGIHLIDLRAKLLEMGLRSKPLTDRNDRPLGVRIAQDKHHPIEITLPRKEISTGPGHRDFDIVLDPDLPLAEDAKRRDFTFNALYRPIGAFFSVADTPYDPTGCGLYDLQHKLIRTTHPDSFRDDPLRILRALRFESTLGYDMTENTVTDMRDHADAVTGLTDKGVSGTVYDEFCKLLMGEFPAKALRIAVETGVLSHVMPELAPMIGFGQESRYHDLTTDEHTFKALETAAHVDAPLRVRWALLFHDAGKPETAWRGKDGRLHYYAQDPKDEVIDAFDGHVNVDHEEYSEILWREAAERMNVPKRLREDVALMVRDHMVPCERPIKPTKIRRWRVKYGDEFLRDLFLHRMCDLSGKGKANAQHMGNIAVAELARKEAVEDGVPATVKDLSINGSDAMLVGLEGRDIGEALAAVLDEVVVDPVEQKLSRDWQMDRLAHIQAFRS